jgi:hypothetical protein
MRWAFRTLNAIVDAEIKGLPSDMQARFLRFAEIIEQVGFEALPREAVKHLDGKLGELRMAGRDGISRAIASIFRKSGHRFSVENATNKRILERFPIQSNRKAL